MKKLLLAGILFLAAQAFAQPVVQIHFIPKVGGVTVEASDLGSTVFHDLSGIAFRIDAMNYYISKLKLTHDGGQEINFDTADDVKLVKVNNHVFNLGQHDITTLEQVDFGVGVAQEWNHLDPNTYAAGHPLGNQQNPVMQWGWTAGYFHMALVALGDNNSDDICDQIYEPQCLGDPNYKNVSLQMTGELNQSNNTYNIYINCNIDEWLYGTDPGTTGAQHTDGPIAVAVMNNVDNRNVFEASPELGLKEVEEVGNTWFYSSGETLTVHWKEMNGMAEWQLVDLNGKVIGNEMNSSPSSKFQFENLKKGMYIFNCYNNDGVRIHSMSVMH